MHRLHNLAQEDDREGLQKRFNSDEHLILRNRAALSAAAVSAAPPEKIFQAHGDTLHQPGDSANGRDDGSLHNLGRLFDAVWGMDREIEENTLERYISMLRLKIDTPGAHKLIHTSRGIGYVMRDEELT